MTEELEKMAANIAAIQARIERACQKAGRSTDEVTLVAVSKTVGPEQVDLAYRCGLRDFGENRVQEGRDKLTAFAASSTFSAGLRERALEGPGKGDVRWHLIGTLQSNKAKPAVTLFDTLQSIDSLHLAEYINAAALNIGLTVPCLLQVNISQETSKHGFSVTEVWSDFEALIALPAIQVRGLMVIAPLADDQEKVRPVFRAARILRDELQQRFPTTALPVLSMGMTDDFAVAIEEGATVVRVGRAIFGERPKSEVH
jgi:pyridoxal phosphate enzyme (YggS family)